MDLEKELNEIFKNGKEEISEVLVEIQKVKDSIPDLDKVLGSVKGKKGDKGESIKGERGSIFIGKFNKVSDLPKVDNINVKPGDWAYIDSTGEIWYA